MDLLQADHTLSGIDIAMWDLLGKRLGEPVYKLLGYPKAYPKTPYASQLFGDTPQQTLEKARLVTNMGYRAAKFGWGPFGRGSVVDDIEHLVAAREGMGRDGILLIDAGTVWQADVEAASLRLKALQDCQATWLEEPFISGALTAYKELAAHSGPVKLAGGEGSHNYYMAQHMIDHAGLGYVQIDAGRIGGITVARDVADYAQAAGVTYVNHTFTSHLALSASLQPYAGLADDTICEYPVEPKALALAITSNHLLPDDQGQIHVPDAPGLGMTPDLAAMHPYLVETEIRVNGQVLYETPVLRE
jgi:L-alanine-DL-glutamate epimerase-like enolase superfamily enzyme